MGLVCMCARVPNNNLQILCFNCVTNPIPGLWQEIPQMVWAVNFSTQGLVDGPDGLATTRHPLPSQTHPARGWEGKKED